MGALLDDVLDHIDNHLLPWSIVEEIEGEGDQPSSNEDGSDSSGPQPNADLIAQLIVLRELVGAAIDAV